MRVALGCCHRVIKIKVQGKPDNALVVFPALNDKDF